MSVYLVGAKNPETRRQVEAQRAADPSFVVAGFIDNDPAKRDTVFLGLPVLGGVDVVGNLLLDDPGTPGRFKTPTLRNVALTGPWLHDGRFHTLADVIRFKTGPAQTATRDILLAEVALDDGQVADLVAFLESLTTQPVDAALIGPGD